MLGVVFLFSEFSPIEIIIFNRTFLYPIEDIAVVSSNLKGYFASDYFSEVLGVEDCQICHVLD